MIKKGKIKPVFNSVILKFPGSVNGARKGFYGPRALCV